MASADSRRRFLRAALSGAAVGLAGCTGLEDPAPPPDQETEADGPPPDSDETPTGTLPRAVGLETVATGFRGALDVAFAPDDRVYVAEQAGRVRVASPDGVRDAPLLDLGDAVTAGGERGLLGFVLHPDYPDDRRCFVRYSAPPREGTPRGASHTFVLAEFSVADDGLGVVAGSERTVLEIPEPQGNHNAGGLAFGPGGLLYVAVGDGGGANDTGGGHADDWFDGNAGGNGQDVTENLLGSILRLDVDAAPTEHHRTDPDAPDGPVGEAGYALPEENPLVGRAGRDEHYAWGFRNPFRLSVDPAGDRVDGGPDIYVGDVGQNRYEEVDLVRPGGNYGWNVREATHCFSPASPSDPPAECPGETPPDVRGGEPLLDPVVEYPQRGAAVSGVSVIGGYIYRGDAVPGLQGRYVFADWRADGDLFVAEPRPAGRWSARLLGVEQSDRVRRVRAFGRDSDGEVYVVADDGSDWGVHRLVAA